MDPQRAEDIIARAELNIVRLLDEIDRLKATLPPTAAAHEAVATATDRRARQARRLRAEGFTVRQIARRLDRTERQVYRLLNR